ncbi:hypothetical protein GCM10027447_17120 [Glycomyces halotolerans]
MNQATDRLCDSRPFSRRVLQEPHMIRTVTDRITSRTRPTYIGRHRRTRPRLASAFRTRTPVPDQSGQSVSGR